MKQRQVSQTPAGEPQFITALVAERPRLPDDQAAIRQGYNAVGHLLDNEEDSLLLVDPLGYDCPVVGISRGFSETSGHLREHVMGQNCRMMLTGVPEVAVSQSVRKNLRDFSRMCRAMDLDHIAEVTSLQPNARRDGSQFMNFFLIGRIMVRSHPYLLSVQHAVGEGLFVKLTGPLLEQVSESVRAIFKRVRTLLESHLAVEFPRLEPQPPAASPGFSFFAGRLQDHCMIRRQGMTALRREPQELATNCLVFGDQPVRQTLDGVFFAVLVDDAVTTFEGLPTVGFTRRRPCDGPGLYPTVSRCLGASVLVGACGEAFARDQVEHFRIGFRPPPQDEVQSWSLEPHLPPHKRRPPVSVSRGDVFGCQYTRSGRIQLWWNGTLVLDFDTGRPVEENADYYAVVDVCLSAYCLTLLPMSSPTDDVGCAVPATAVSSCDMFEDDALGLSLSHRLDEVLSRLAQDGPGADASAADADPGIRSGNIDDMVSDVVNNALVQKAIRAAVGECQFCVTIADPKGNDIPLIAVSEAFESVTGYKRSEILGSNCRFLNQGCPVSPMDLMGLRRASESGSAFTALLPNRKKSGEMFVNWLDLRGLTIARHVETDEALWYLIGIQANVTGLAESRIPEDHLSEFREVAQLIRNKLKKKLSLLAAEGADRFDRQATSSSCSSLHLDAPSQAWRLLEEPEWMTTSLSQEAVLDIARRSRSDRAGDAAPSPRREPPARRGLLQSSWHACIAAGQWTAGAIVACALGLVVGMLFGRTRRR